MWAGVYLTGVPRWVRVHLTGVPRWVGVHLTGVARWAVVHLTGVPKLVGICYWSVMGEGENYNVNAVHYKSIIHLITLHCVQPNDEGGGGYVQSTW